MPLQLSCVTTETIMQQVSKTEIGHAVLREQQPSAFRPTELSYLLSASSLPEGAVWLPKTCIPM